MVCHGQYNTLLWEESFRWLRNAAGRPGCPLKTIKFILNHNLRHSLRAIPFEILATPSELKWHRFLGKNSSTFHSGAKIVPQMESKRCQGWLHFFLSVALCGPGLFDLNIGYRVPTGRNSQFPIKTWVRSHGIHMPILMGQRDNFRSYLIKVLLRFPTRHNSRITRGIHVKFTTSFPRVIREFFMFIMTICGVIK